MLLHVTKKYGAFHFCSLPIATGVPYTSPTSGLLVTYNINNGVQFMGNRPLHPPPYSEIMRVPPREGPPPPYDSRENISMAAAPVTISPPVNTSSQERNAINLRRTEYSQSDRSDGPATLEPLLNDNNNGDINGNSTESVQVEPNRNQDHLDQS